MPVRERQREDTKRKERHEERAIPGHPAHVLNVALSDASVEAVHPTVAATAKTALFAGARQTPR